MGVKAIYYLDAAFTWILFLTGIIALSFGIGGFLLTTPYEKANVSYPWYHASGVLIGILYILLAMTSPFAVAHNMYIRLSLALIYIVIILAGTAVGLQIDELVVWFENPDVELIQKNVKELQTTPQEEEVVNEMILFYYFHKIRIGIVMFSTLVGISLLLYKSVNLGMQIMDDLIWNKQKVLFAEEHMMYEMIAEYQIQSMESKAQTMESKDQTAAYKDQKTFLKEQQALQYGTGGQQVENINHGSESDNEIQNYNNIDFGAEHCIEPFESVKFLFTENEKRPSVIA